MKKNKKPLSIIIAFAVILITAAMSATSMFVIDVEKETNRVTMGYNEVIINNDFVPPVELVQGENEYKQTVSIKNTGNVDLYARVFVAFSSKEIEDISEVSNDNGETYYSLSNFTPSDGWVKGNDSYYYYEDPIKPGETTPALLTNVKTTFVNAEDISQHELIIYSESIQIRNKDGDISEGFDYSSAWQEYLNRS